MPDLEILEIFLQIKIWVSHHSSMQRCIKSFLYQYWIHLYRLHPQTHTNTSRPLTDASTHFLTLLLLLIVVLFLLLLFMFWLLPWRPFGEECRRFVGFSTDSNHRRKIGIIFLWFGKLKFVSLLDGWYW